MESISVIIPCRNEEKYIGQCIQSLVDMDFEEDKMEIIIVDAESSDNSLKIIKQYQDKYTFIRVLKNLKRYTPFGLNLGIKNAKHEFIMIAGAHSVFSKEYLREIFSAITNLGADVAGGVMITGAKNKNRKTVSICKVLSHKLGVGNSLFRTGAAKTILVDTVPFGVYRKQLFDDVGLYNERLIRNHDIELSGRIIASGKKIYLVPSAECTYYVRETFSGLAKNNFANGLWNILTVYITWKINSISLRHFVPLIFLLSLILPFILNIWIPRAALLAALSFAIYILTVLITGLRINNKDTSYYFIVVTFFILHFCYGLGSLTGLFKFNYLFKRN